VAHYQLGLIDRQDKKYEAAIVHFEEALTLNPNFAQALGQIASIRVSRGEAKEARERVQKQIDAIPDNPFLYNLLGGLWMQANQADKAEQAFKKSLEVNDQLQVSYMNLAELYRRTKRTDEAVQEYERLLEKNPEVASAHMMLGMIAEQRKDITSAQRHYRKTLEIEPKFAPAANNLAWLMAEHGGNLDEALAFAERARAQQEDNPHIADTLGWIYYKKTAYVKAVSLLQEAADKLPENPMVQYHLGMAQFKNGDRQKGKKALEAAFQLSPNFPGSEEAKATLEML
jgi:tetratricopeptide (TPR) repeat protein